ncbi:MAG: hypothetical protein ACI9ES_000485, partial [Oceanospirillaceae bacterium]
AGSLKVAISYATKLAHQRQQQTKG